MNPTSQNAYLFIITLLLLFSSCKEEDFYTPAPSGNKLENVALEDLSEAQRAVVEYFTEIALGFEYGSASRVTRKWREDMRVYVSGDISEEMRAELDKIINEINQLTTDGFSVGLVEEQTNANYHVFIGSAAAYANLYPGVSDLVDANWGMFSLDWDNQQNLNWGHMYVDNTRGTATEQRHLLREEFTQSLGLARDATRYANSIFQSNWTSTTSYAAIDKELIRLLYHPEIKSGMSKTAVESMLASILLGEPQS